MQVFVFVSSYHIILIGHSLAREEGGMFESYACGAQGDYTDSDFDCVVGLAEGEQVTICHESLSK